MHELLVKRYVDDARKFMRTDKWPREREPSWTELVNVITALADERDAGRDKRLADKLMGIAARRSVHALQGWANPDCADLVEAARLLRGEPRQPIQGIDEGVLS